MNSPGQQPKLFGRAVTARCEPPDFGAVLHALDQINHGDVLVIAADGRNDAAMIGEILGGHLRRCGGAGLICDGAIRDIATLSQWPDFSVFARSVNPRVPTEAAKGAVNSPVNIGGRLINPGDLMIGDDERAGCPVGRNGANASCRRRGKEGSRSDMGRRPYRWSVGCPDLRPQTRKAGRLTFEHIQVVRCVDVITGRIWKMQWIDDWSCCGAWSIPGTMIISDT